MSAKLGLKTASYLVKKPLSTNKLRLKKSKDEAIGKIIIKTLSQMKGLAVKLAQFLSMEEGLLPEAMRKELHSANYNVTPLTKAVVRKAVKVELGDIPENIFHTFDYIPFAAASLGQVHKATILSNQQEIEVAVKIQYPGIANTIESDIALLTGVLKISGWYNTIAPGLEEIKITTLQEVDYEQEAANTKRYYEENHNPLVIVPRVYQEYSTKRILTTELLHGMHLNEWLATNPEQRLKNKLSQALYDNFLFGMYEMNSLHADPNPGNILFLPEGKIGLIDFGCMKTFDKDFIQMFQTLTNLLKERDSKGGCVNLDDYESIGLIKQSPSDQIKRDLIDKQILNPTHEWIVIPFKAATYDFGKDQEFFEKWNSLRSIPIQGLKDLHVHENFIFLDRTRLGLYRLFKNLDAKVKILSKWEYQ